MPPLARPSQVDDAVDCVRALGTTVYDGVIRTLALDAPQTLLDTWSAHDKRPNFVNVLMREVSLTLVADLGGTGGEEKCRQTSGGAISV